MYLPFTKPIPDCNGRITMKKLSGTALVYYTYAHSASSAGNDLSHGNRI